MYILKSNIRTLPTEKVQDVSEYTLHCKLVSFLGIQIAFFLNDSAVHPGTLVLPESRFFNTS